MKLYYFLGRLFKPALTAGFHFYCVVTRTPRVRVIVTNEKNEILLVKTWLSSDEWGFPGGGVNRGESFQKAAQRELREETGIVVPENQFQLLYTIRTWGHDEVVFSAAATRDSLPEALPSRYEIKEAAWFSNPAVLNLGPLARQIAAKLASER